MLYDENEELDRLNAGPSFDVVETVEDSEDVNGENLMDAPEEKLEDIVADEDIVNTIDEVKGNRYRDHLPLPLKKDEETGYMRYDPAYGYSLGGEPPVQLEGHHWIEQDDGSWLCSTCGEQKQRSEKQGRDKRSFDLDAYAEEALQRVKDYKRKNGEIVASVALEPESAFLDNLLQEIDTVKTGSNQIVESQGPFDSNAPMDSLIGLVGSKVNTSGSVILDSRLKREKKFELDFAKSTKGVAKEGIVTDLYDQPPLCDYKCNSPAQYMEDGKPFCSQHVRDKRKAKRIDDSGGSKCSYHCYELAKYDVEGQKYCYQHMNEKNVKDLGMATVKKIECNKVVKLIMIDGVPCLRKESLGDLDRMILEKQNKPIGPFPCKIIDDIRFCTIHDCGLEAYYEFHLKSKGIISLCESHSEDQIENHWEDVAYVYKLMTETYASSESVTNKVIIPEVRDVSEGCKLINVSDIIRRMRSKSGVRAPEALLYWCPDDVADQRGGRYKIVSVEDPEDEKYFNLGYIDPVRSAYGPIEIYFSRDLMNKAVAKEVFEGYLRGKVGEKTVILDDYDLIMSLPTDFKKIDDVSGIEIKRERESRNTPGKAYERWKEVLIKDRIPWGKESFIHESVGTCYDCGVKPGEIHKYGCGMEECPVCHGEFINCKEKCLDKINGIEHFPDWSRKEVVEDNHHRRVKTVKVKTKTKKRRSSTVKKHLMRKNVVG